MHEYIHMYMHTHHIHIHVYVCKLFNGRKVLEAFWAKRVVTSHYGNGSINGNEEIVSN